MIILRQSSLHLLISLKQAIKIKEITGEEGIIAAEVVDRRLFLDVNSVLNKVIESSIATNVSIRISHNQTTENLSLDNNPEVYNHRPI